MAMWGMLIQHAGTSYFPSDSDEFVDDFFKKTRQEERWQLPKIEAELHAFIHTQLKGPNKRRGIALVTSGATIVPLDPTDETFVDQSSQVQEYQGPACAEYLLHLGYAVIFVHREDSLQPFTRHFQKYIQNGAFMDMLHVRNDEMVIDGVDRAQKTRFENIVSLHHDAKDRLFNISFTTVQQYLQLLRLTTKAVHVAKTRAIVILAASVMDFYLPIQENTKVAIGRVDFVRGPNVVGKIRKDWCPEAFLVTFKHRLHDDEMVERAHKDLEKWGVDVVAGVNRIEHQHQILLVSEQEDTIVNCLEDEDINDAFASSIAEMHRDFRCTREKGSELLLASL